MNASPLHTPDLAALSLAIFGDEQCSAFESRCPVAPVAQMEGSCKLSEGLESELASLMRTPFANEGMAGFLSPQSVGIH